MGTKKIGDLITDNMGVYEGKTKLSFGKLVLLGMLAGAFIAIGASSSSAAVTESAIQVLRSLWQVQSSRWD